MFPERVNSFSSDESLLRGDINILAQSDLPWSSLLTLNGISICLSVFRFGMMVICVTTEGTTDQCTNTIQHLIQILSQKYMTIILVRSFFV